MRLAIILLSAVSVFAQPRQSVLESIDAALRADAGFTAEQRSELTSALRDRFADYGIQSATGARAEGVKVALRMLVEGSFDEAPAERSADVAFAAYQAVSRGAPPEVVEGIGLYGFRKKVPADTLSAWANGYNQMTKSGVPSDVSADLVREAMESDWDVSTYNMLKNSIIDSARQKFDTRAYATYLLGSMKQDAKRPGALTAQAQGYFRKIAKTGEKPVLPKYEGTFHPTEKAAEPQAQPEPQPEPKLPAKTSPAKTVVKTPPVKNSPPQDKPKRSYGAFDKMWPDLDRASRSYLGTPYVWGGVTRRGIDCSALMQNSYEEVEVKLPRVSKDQWKTGSEIDTNRWREGDLVFFNTLGNGVSHVGMVVDVKGPQFIHASSSKGVVIADLSKNYYKTRYLGARRVVP